MEMFRVRGRSLPTSEVIRGVFYWSVLRTLNNFKMLTSLKAILELIRMLRTDAWAPIVYKK